MQFKWRNHDPALGRFFSVDPLADKYVYNSPYSFSENHVTSHVELEGLEKVILFGGADLKGDGSVGSPLPGNSLNTSWKLRAIEMSYSVQSGNINLTNGQIKHFGVRYNEAGYTNFISK